MKPQDVILHLQNKLGIVVSLPTLYHWEQKDLIGEIHVGDTGRKDHSYHNINLILQIAILRRMGLSVRQAKRWLDGEDFTKKVVVEELISWERKRIPYVKRMIERG